VGYTGLMARVNPFALYPPSFEAALRGILAGGASSKAASPKAQKRQPTTRKAKTAKAKKKRKKK
jgi:hypothetical protein